MLLLETDLENVPESMHKALLQINRHMPLPVLTWTGTEGRLAVKLRGVGHCNELFQDAGEGRVQTCCRENHTKASVYPRQVNKHWPSLCEDRGEDCIQALEMLLYRRGHRQ